MCLIKFGIQCENYYHRGEKAEIFENIKRMARFAEDGGVDSFWVPDHLMQIPSAGDLNEPMLEGWVTISSLSQVTRRIMLGTLVSGIIYRSPALLAKMGSTLDVISGGRLLMGIGAGWFELEAMAYGINFYPALERLLRLKESVQIIREMWSRERSTFIGQYYQVEDAYCNPRPVQLPHPPIIIGGNSKTVLDLVSRYADGCNLYNGSPEMVKGQLETLKNYCRISNRDYDGLIRSRLGRLIIGSQEEVSAGLGRCGVIDEKMNYPVYGTPEQVRASIRAFVDAGLDYLIFNFEPGTEEKSLKLFTEEVIPYFK